MPSSIHDVFAYLRVRDTAAAIAFYTHAFGAQRRYTALFEASSFSSQAASPAA